MKITFFLIALLFFLRALLLSERNGANGHGTPVTITTQYIHIIIISFGAAGAGAAA